MTTRTRDILQLTAIWAAWNLALVAIFGGGITATVSLAIGTALVVAPGIFMAARANASHHGERP